jgi:hypothetical protein
MKFMEEDAKLVRKVEKDDPAFNPEREMFVVQKQDGMEVYAARDDLEDIEDAEKELQEQPKGDAPKADIPKADDKKPAR